MRGSREIISKITLALLASMVDESTKWTGNSFHVRTISVRVSISLPISQKDAVELNFDVNMAFKTTLLRQRYNQIEIIFV